MGADLPKQFLKIAGRPVLEHTLRLFEKHARIDGIYLVCNPKFRDRTERLVSEGGFKKICAVVDGGPTAQDSIFNGLTRVARDCDRQSIVLLHDGVRPYVDPAVIDANIDAVEKYGSAVTYTPSVETLVISRDGRGISAIPFRRESFAAQAPQSFRLGDILAAHERIRKRPEGYTDMVDQATICFSLGIPVHLVPGNRGNLKITTPEDLVMLEALLEKGSLRV